MKRVVAAALATGAIAVGAALGLPAAFASGGSGSSPVSSASPVVGCVFVDGGCASTPSSSVSLPVNHFAAVGLCATNDSGVPYPVSTEQFTTNFGTLYNGAAAGSANDPGDAVGQTAIDDLNNSATRNEIHGGNIADVQQPADCYYVLVGSSAAGTATVSAQADGVTLDSTVRITFH